MSFGIGATGFNRKTFEILLNEILVAVRNSTHKQLTLDSKDPIGALCYSLADQLSVAWQALESSANALDPDNADGFAAENQASMLGVRRLPAAVGVVSATVNLDASKTYAAGDLIAHVVGEPSNRWVNADAITSTTAGDYAATFNSESTGSTATALSGTLTIIAVPKTGWNSITNATDATPGTDVESIEALLQRKRVQLEQLGNSDAVSVQSAVTAVTDVIATRVYENDTDATDGDGLPPHSIRVQVYDGASPTADDDEIAQAILGTKTSGIRADGSTDSGTAVDVNGDNRTIDFNRATVTTLHAELTVTTEPGTDTDAIKAAVRAAVPAGLGDTVYVSQLEAAALSVDGVVDVTGFKLDTVDPPVATANYVTTISEAVDLPTANIDVL